jgi:DNA mismatch repair protein MutL
MAEAALHPLAAAAGRGEGPCIRLLSEATVNRIAAGEVIERPAAAVRELVENALDAGAGRVAVSLAAGGTACIAGADDGCGMDGAELALAVQRHATSKLPDDDLVRITTLGFRGEALPSIGAAAKLCVTSRRHGTEHAWTLSIEGGAVGAVTPASGPPGTVVVARELFFATPARRKFLKSDRVEAEASEAVVRRLALAAPGVAFRLENDGRVAFDLPGQDRTARVGALLGPDAASVLLPVAGERDGAVLSGFACAPSFTRATVSGQALVVNGRPVADPLLRVAVRVAYRDVTPAGRHAVVALFLDLPPDTLDVNVHPAKAEVRFSDPDGIRGLVIGSLGRALSGGAGETAPPRRFAPRPSLRLVPPARNPGFAEAALPFPAPPSARTLAPPPMPPAAAHPLGAPVAQVLDTYIIAVAADGSLVLIDQHAAHERLTHEALRDQLLGGATVAAQPLLSPVVVDLSRAAVALLAERAAEFSRLGVELEPFGPGAVLVRSLPAVLGAADPASLLRDLADELGELGETIALDARLDAMIARMACHGSIRAGRRLGAKEMAALLRRMEATPRAATCSHGRPTFIKLSRGEIERLFGRR